MATIQVRDLPDDTYELLRRQADAAGQSLQKFMREQLIEMADRRALKAEAIERLESYLVEHGGIGASAEQIVADVHADRR